MTHIHHWRIDSPTGPMSEGRCECGEARSFRNSCGDIGYFEAQMRLTSERFRMRSHAETVRRLG